ncbi:hypothetical protein Pcinc_003810 [Petrolisthes cinctipes]|uniref:Major facilitator superfamily (MFS) profile domain-containing protein n=1 Tax=Petrolisthes cinctipes TaxID=88211 RepID=A0AAE1L282_PETCI|nr:hypothetical protein Pcinc_003810 [Petrolisthes cinctipes]
MIGPGILSCPQLNWVCEEDWKPSLSQSLLYVGAFIAFPVLGWASDRWGRLPIIVATSVMGGAAGVASAFTDSFVAFVSLQFLVGMTFNTHYTITYILRELLKGVDLLTSDISNELNHILFSWPPEVG